MPPVPPIPAELWDQIPPAAQAAILALIQKYEQRLQALQRKVDQLTERLNQNSTNSARPPSSDPPHVKRRPPKPSTGRKKGGQPGHARQQRPLVPPEQVKQTIPLMPSACRKCGQAPQGDDPHPRRHQVAEIPPVEADDSGTDAGLAEIGPEHPEYGKWLVVAEDGEDPRPVEVV
jgi:transposase